MLTDLTKETTHKLNFFWLSVIAHIWVYYVPENYIFKLIQLVALTLWTTYIIRIEVKLQFESHKQTHTHANIVYKHRHIDQLQYNAFIFVSLVHWCNCNRKGKFTSVVTNIYYKYTTNSRYKRESESVSCAGKPLKCQCINANRISR